MAAESLYQTILENLEDYSKTIRLYSQLPPHDVTLLLEKAVACNTTLVALILGSAHTFERRLGTYLFSARKEPLTLLLNSGSFYLDTATLIDAFNRLDSDLYRLVIGHYCDVIRVEIMCPTFVHLLSSDNFLKRSGNLKVWLSYFGLNGIPRELHRQLRCRLRETWPG